MKDIITINDFYNEKWMNRKKEIDELYLKLRFKKEVKMKDKILKVLNWVITIATAITVLIDKLPF